MSIDDDLLELEQFDSDLALALPLVGNTLHEVLNLLQVAYEWQPAVRKAIHEMKLLQIYRNREASAVHRQRHEDDLQAAMSGVKNNVDISLVRDALRQAEALLVNEQLEIQRLMRSGILGGQG